MYRIIKINPPLDEEEIMRLAAGDRVLISGVIYTARDAALARLTGAEKKKTGRPLELSGQVVYFAGPAPAPPGKVIGSIGPTTASRLERFIPFLLKRGVKGILGKGDLGPSTVARLKASRAVYLAAVGGAGAFLSGKVKAAETVAYADLGPEAILKLKVENFPAVVAVDVRGNTLFKKSG